ncbi:hypothetical protein EDC04DRAFT_1302002 [Pisolithus marmoratus]|nr:hypothetical protein EDC04DRAFT_1302002 [Pisolithus marmoratus]
MAGNLGDSSAFTASDHRVCPPSPSPSPEANDSVAQHCSRKREREVSLEPALPKTSVLANASDVKSPAKKGRVHPDSTLEEEDAQQRSRSRTPPNPNSPALGVSPPHEVKVRQISQGVEDINWQRQRPAQNNAESESHDVEALQDKEDGQTIVQEKPDEDQDEPSSSFPPVQDTAVDAETADLPSSLPHSRRASESEVAEPEKGLKRKLADRGTSQGPESAPSSPSVHTTSTEPAKRPRDDGDDDDNPRQPKRQSPPPEQQEKPPAATETSTPKWSGFMAYASAASPFASVKGQNVFASASSNKKPPMPPTPPSTSLPGNSNLIRPPLPQTPLASLAQQSYLQQTPPSTATKRTGFEAFAGSASPFSPSFGHSRSMSPVAASSRSVLVRSKSPVRRANFGANAGAFPSYASGGTQAFAVPHPKRARAESPSNGSSRSSLERRESFSLGAPGSNENSTSGEEEEDEGEDEKEENEGVPSSFGEKLRSVKDVEDSHGDQEKEKLTEQEVLTGEEEEETIHQVRGKLYVLCPQNQWKERGTGQLRLNVRRADGGGARLVMRKEAVYTVILNVTLFPGMKCFIAQDPRYLRFSAIDGGTTVHYNLRVSNAKIAQELLEEIDANIPP